MSLLERAFCFLSCMPSREHLVKAVEKDVDTQVMREKTLWAVITFASTADAMAMESAALNFSLPGRIIPVPSDISASCGLSWRVSPEELDVLLAAMKAHGIAHENVYQVKMY